MEIKMLLMRAYISHWFIADLRDFDEVLFKRFMILLEAMREAKIMSVGPLCLHWEGSIKTTATHVGCADAPGRTMNSPTASL
jgi:hypothetical protein